MSSCNSEKWLLVEWGNGARGVVHSRYMLNRENPNLRAGSTITISRRGEQQLATYIARSDERQLLEQIIGDEAGPSVPPEPEVEDFSPSASSWEPSDEEQSDSEVEVKRAKLDNFRKKISEEKTSKIVLTPTNRVNAVIPNSMRKSQQINNIKKYVNCRKRAHDLTKQTQENNNNTEDIKNTKDEPKTVKVEIEPKSVLDVFVRLIGLINLVYKEAPQDNEEKNETIIPHDVQNETTLIGDVQSERSHSEESNRSDDNVLITNKYDNVENNTENQKTDDEWVPIGSGKTLIHKDKYRKVKWTSYTIATRTLLLALFPRRTLATHSLTGKRSPAFQDKPAKMCLDPKKIADIIIEVIDRFNVRENLVRSIITTKCADESKMFRTRMEKKKLHPKNEKIENEESNKENDHQEELK